MHPPAMFLKPHLSATGSLPASLRQPTPATPPPPPFFLFNSMNPAITKTGDCLLRRISYDGTHVFHLFAMTSVNIGK